jgi:hypothetical protein
MATITKKMTRNPHSTAPANRAGSQAITAAATTSAAVVVASFKGMVKAVRVVKVAVSAMVQAKVVRVKEALVGTARAAKAVRVEVAAVKAVVKAASPTLCVPVLMPWANAAVIVAVAVAEAAVVANPVAAVGVLTRCAPALAASNKLAA